MSFSVSSCSVSRQLCSGPFDSFPEHCLPLEMWVPSPVRTGTVLGAAPL